MTSLSPLPTNPSGFSATPDAARTQGPVAPLILGLVLAVAVMLLVAGPDRVGRVVSDLFAAYVAAQHKMLQASGNITADGRAEFAVLLQDAADAPAFLDAVNRIDDVTFEREADLPGWMIVTTEAGNRAGLDALLALPEARVVMPNRGLWICH